MATTLVGALRPFALAVVVMGACHCGSSSASEVPAYAVPAYARVLEPKLAALVKETLTPGAAVVVRSRELGDWDMTFGTRAFDGGEPVTLDDHVRIGSNTKTWTGTVILQLVEEGKLSLSEPIATFRSDVPNGEHITIEHLLGMRSGLPNYSVTVAMNQRLDDTPEAVWTPDELLALAFEMEPSFAPGKGYEYSNTNTVLLGLVIEQLTGMNVENAFAERIFARLGLSNSVMPARASNAIPSPYPRGYQFGTNVETIASLALPDEQQSAARDGTLKPFDATDNNPSWGWTAGAGISTAIDLARYARALAEGGLLGDDMQRRRIESVRPIDPENPEAPGYGWALAKFGALYGHTGELPGYNTFMGHDPERGITVITWTSLSAAPDGRANAVEMAKLVIAELYGSEDGVRAPSAGSD